MDGSPHLGAGVRVGISSDHRGVYLNLQLEDEGDEMSSESESCSSTEDEASAKDDEKKADMCVDSHGYRKLCAFTGMLGKCESRGTAVSDLLHAHTDILYLLESANDSRTFANVDWKRIQGVVEQIVAGENRRGRKLLEKELRYNKGVKAGEGFEQSSQRLLNVLGAMFSSNDGGNGDVGKEKVDSATPVVLDLKTYEASLDRPQRRALTYVQQLWRKSFRGKSTGTIDTHKIRLDLCYDFTVLVGAQSLGFEVVVCADPTKGMPDFSNKIAKLAALQGQNVLFTFCGCAAEQWHVTLAFLDEAIDKKLARFVGIRERELRTLRPCSADFLMHSATHKDADTVLDAHASLLKGRIDKTGALEAEQARLIFEKLQDVMTLPAAPRGLPSLLTLCAAVFKRVNFDIDDVPKHLRSAVTASYKCVSCKSYVLPQIKNKSALAATQAGEARAAAAGFSTDAKQAAALRASILAGDAWFPPLIEEFGLLRLPNGFHMAVKHPEHCRQLHRGGQTLCERSWPRTILSRSITIGGRGMSIARDTNDESNDYLHIEDWQFCVACAKHHLCDQVARQPACGCQVCAYEASVLRNEEDALIWRRFDVTTVERLGRTFFGFLPMPNSSKKTRIAQCPFCEDGTGHTCQPIV